jgi:hypothetical protein
LGSGTWLGGLSSGSPRFSLEPGSPLLDIIQISKAKGFQCPTWLSVPGIFVLRGWLVTFAICGSFVKLRMNLLLDTIVLIDLKTRIGDFVKIQEKRLFKRFKFNKILKVSTVVPSKSGLIYEVQPQLFEIFSHDMSEGGLRIQNVKRFEKDTILKMNLELGRNNVLETFGQVTWSDRYHCGINFLLLGQEFRKNVRQLALRNALHS